MNKPDWHTGWIFKDAEKTKIIPVAYRWEKPVLDEWIKSFIDELNERLK